MDEKYYKRLIDTVKRNDKMFWEKFVIPSDSRKDFDKLWGILNDEDAQVSPKTYFEAMRLCVDSYYGIKQKSLPVWESIAKKYEGVLNGDNQNSQEFITAFRNFLDSHNVGHASVSLFYEMMRWTVNAGDLETARKIVKHYPVPVEDHDALTEIYEEYPEFGAYIECLTDITVYPLPVSSEFKDTVCWIFSKLGSLPGTWKLKYTYKECIEN